MTTCPDNVSRLGSGAEFDLLIESSGLDDFAHIRLISCPSITKASLFDWLNITVGGNRRFQLYIMFRWTGTTLVEEALRRLTTPEAIP